MPAMYRSIVEVQTLDVPLVNTIRYSLTRHRTSLGPNKLCYLRCRMIQLVLIAAKVSKHEDKETVVFVVIASIHPLQGCA
jgi:hypothetical protein